MRKELAIAVCILFLLSSCQPYGKSADILETRSAITTTSINMQDIVAQALARPIPTILGDTITLPNIHTALENEADAKKLLKFMIQTACSKAKLADETGKDLCTTGGTGSTGALITGNFAAITGMQTAGTPDPYSRPDLTIKTYSLSTLTPLAGSSMTATVQVQNIGDYDAGSIMADVVIDGVRIGRAGIAGGCLPTQTRTGTIAFRAPTVPGTYTVRLHLDMANVWHSTAASSLGIPGIGGGWWVGESDTSNNDVDITITVQPPVTPPATPYADLTVDATTFEQIPTIPVPGGSMNILVNIVNIGTLACDGGEIKTYLDGSILNTYPLSQFTPSVQPNLGFRFGDQFQTPAAGSHTFEVEAICTNPVDPLAYNNKATHFFDVSAEHDLRAVSITPGKTTYLDTEPVELTLEVDNPASKRSTALVRLEVDGTTANEYNVGIEPQQKDTRTITLNPLPVGQHTINLIVDPLNTLKESDEGNNAVSIQLTITALGVPISSLPDLTVPRLQLDPVVTPITTDTNIKVSFDIKNSGITKAEATKYAVILDGTTLGMFDTPTLKAGKTYTTQGNLGKLPVGTHTITIRADALDSEIEHDENNNERSLQVTVQPAVQLPDLKPYVTITPALLLESEPIKLEITIANEGNVPSGSTEYHLFVDSAQVDEVRIPPLDTIAGVPGSNLFTSTQPLALAAGQHLIEVRVDPNNGVDETDEQNNNYVETITVSQAGKPYVYVRGAKIMYPPAALSGPTFVIGTCTANPQVRQLLGSSTCNALEQGDRLIASMPSVPAVGWVMVITGGTANDVSEAVDLFINIEQLGPDEIYNELRMRKPEVPSLGLQLYANYYNKAGTKLHYLNYELTTQPLTLIGFPIEMNKNLQDVLQPIAAQVEAVYDWDPEMQKWGSYRATAPSDITTFDRHTGYFLKMTSTPAKILMYDIQDIGGTTTFAQGRALFTPKQRTDLNTLSQVFDLTQPVYCQLPSMATGWRFEKVTPGKIDIGQSCWVVSKGGAI